MEIARADVTGVRARAIVYRPIPVGMIGGTVRFEYSDHLWDGLNKTVVFQAGDITKDVVNPGELVVIPPEITRQVRRNVLVGVYGTDSQQNLVIPTLWATIGRVQDATSPSGDTSTDESLPVWAQLQGMIGNLDDLDTTAKENLVAAINDAMTKGGGGAASFETDNTLILEDGILRVNTTDVAEKDNTQPITSAGVDSIVGNIGAILDTI